MESQKPSFGPDVESPQDIAVRELRNAISVVFMKYGAWFVMKVVASILAPYRRYLYEETFRVKESKTMNYFSIPASLRNKKIEDFPALRSLQKAALWRQTGESGFFSLTSHPYYVSKEDMKKLIAHCDEYDIDFQVDAESYYWPGHTIRFLFKTDEVTKYDATAQIDRWAVKEV